MKIPRKALLLTPTILYILGFLMNCLVIRVNNGKMPVLEPGGCQQEELPIRLTYYHSCMDDSTKLKFLGDWLLIPHEGMYSPGDFLLEQNDWTFYPCLFGWILLLLRDINA